MKYADTIVAEIEKKERLLSKSQGNPNSCSSRIKTPVSYFAPHSLDIADNYDLFSD